MAESAADRFARDWAQQGGNRKERGLDNQSTERKTRLYVAPDGSTPADDE